MSYLYENKGIYNRIKEKAAEKKEYIVGFIAYGTIIGTAIMVPILSAALSSPENTNRKSVLEEKLIREPMKSRGVGVDFEGKTGIKVGPNMIIDDNGEAKLGF